jgi:hypothetical protein
MTQAPGPGLRARFLNILVTKVGMTNYKPHRWIMAKRPKRYGGTEREAPEQVGRQEGPGREGRAGIGRHQEDVGRAGRGGRASEAENWEREESLDDEDREDRSDLSDDEESDDLGGSARGGR